MKIKTLMLATVLASAVVFAAPAAKTAAAPAAKAAPAAEAAKPAAEAPKAEAAAAPADRQRHVHIVVAAAGGVALAAGHGGEDVAGDGHRFRIAVFEISLHAFSLSFLIF